MDGKIGTYQQNMKSTWVSKLPNNISTIKDWPIDGIYWPASLPANPGGLLSFGGSVSWISHSPVDLLKKTGY